MLQQAVTQQAVPLSAEVINDFLWLPSNCPSIVNPLFMIEAPSSTLFYLCPFFWYSWMDSDTSLEKQEALAGRRRRVIFMIHFGSDPLQTCSYHASVSAPCTVSCCWLSAQTWPILRLLWVLGHKVQIRSTLKSDSKLLQQMGLWLIEWKPEIHAQS